MGKSCPRTNNSTRTKGYKMSIWHSADELPPEDSYVVVKLTSGKCEVGFEFEYDFDHIENWAFFDDLLALETELDRIRKALDAALDCLNGVGKELPWVKRTLEKITALEQKEHFADTSKMIEQKENK